MISLSRLKEMEEEEMENKIKELEEKLSSKEQECEELKKIINEAKNSKLDLKSFLVGEAIQNEYEQKLDQLKAENESLKKQLKYEFDETLLQYSNRLDELHKTLTEIKEIATNFYETGFLRTDNGCILINNNTCVETLDKILQKISEVEG